MIIMQPQGGQPQAPQGRVGMMPQSSALDQALQNAQQQFSQQQGQDPNATQTAPNQLPQSVQQFQQLGGQLPNAGNAPQPLQGPVPQGAQSQPTPMSFQQQLQNPQVQQALSAISNFLGTIGHPLSTVFDQHNAQAGQTGQDYGTVEQQAQPQGLAGVAQGAGQQPQQ